MANGFVNIRYNPANDPFQHLASGLGNFLGPVAERRAEDIERQEQATDLAAIKEWVDGGMEGPPPNTNTIGGQELAGRIVLDRANEAIADPSGRLRRQEIKRFKAERKLREAQAGEAQARTRIIGEPSGQKFGPTPWFLSPEMRNTAEGKGALKKSLEGSTDLEALRFWQGIMNNAAGDYFNPTLEGGASAPDDPEGYEFARKEFLEVKNRIEKSGNAPSESISTPPPFTQTRRAGLARPVTDAEYDSIVPGAEYIHPDGSIRIKGAQ